MMQTFFISDLHLSPDEPGITDLLYRFLTWIRAPENATESLYILGDLFALWIGDDACGAFEHQIASAIAELKQAGIRVYYLPGNRDYLLGDAYLAQSGMTRLLDPTQITLYGQQVLLKHGDDLCSDDRSHQWFRKVSRRQWVRGLFLHLPLAWRRSIARRIHRLGRRRQQQRPLARYDVTTSAIAQVFRQYSVDYLIHGHTHQPGVDNRRYTLGDWGKQGHYLMVSDEGQWQLCYYTPE